MPEPCQPVTVCDQFILFFFSQLETELRGESVSFHLNCKEILYCSDIEFFLI